MGHLAVVTSCHPGQTHPVLRALLAPVADVASSLGGFWVGSGSAQGCHAGSDVLKPQALCAVSCQELLSPPAPRAVPLGSAAGAQHSPGSGWGVRNADG